MARKNVKHHKIPRTYLAGFTDEKGLLWVAGTQRNIYSQKPEHVLTESDYYQIRFSNGGGTLDIETRYLNGIEATYAKIYKEKIAIMKPLVSEEKAKLAIFVASMLQRQPMVRNSLQKFATSLEEKVAHMRTLPDSVKKQLSRMPNISKSKGVPANEVLDLLKDIGSVHTSMIPEVVTEIAPIVFNMNWCFMVRANQANPFITSDNPCILINPLAEKTFGRGTIGAAAGLLQPEVELTLPLSSNITLLCGWILESDLEFKRIEARHVDEMNRRSRRQATTVISSDKKFLEEMITETHKQK